MTISSRYDVDPIRNEGKKDIVEHIIDLARRISNKETSLQVGHTAIEDGDLVVRNGDIIVSESDNSIVLRLVHGAVPEIRMWPLGDIDTHRASIFGQDDVVAGQTLGLQIETSPAGNLDGGNIFIAKNYLLMSHFPDGGDDSQLWLNGDPVNPMVCIYRGRWADQIQYDNQNGLYMGSFVASSGFSTWTHSYFTSFATTFIPVLTVLHAGSTISWTIDAQSTASFTVRFSSTTNAKTINFWGFRL